MSKLTRTIAAVALVLAASFAFAGVAGAQTTNATPDYTGVSPTTQDQGAGAGAGDLARGAGAAGTGALPVTGGDSLPVAQLGVALLAVGAITVLAVRKRNAAASRR